MGINYQINFLSMLSKALLRIVWFIPLFLTYPSTASSLEVEAAKYITLPRERIFDGVIEAVHRSTVSAQLMGRIIEINYDVDDFVPKGAVILQFRGSEQKARSSQAEAVLREARARRKEAEDEHQRIKDIYKKKLISRAELDKAEASLKATKARLDAAEAGLDEARVQAGYTVVRAPYSGYVLQRHVEVGETVNVGQPLMTGVSLEALRATVNIPQAFVKDVRENKKAIVMLADGRRVDSKSVRVFPFADEKSHAFKVRVNLPEEDYGVYPGTFVKVAFVTGDVGRLLIPAAAVVHRSELTAVYILNKKGRVSFRQVRTGWRNDDLIEIHSGLDENEMVALDPIAAGIELKQQGR